MRFPPVLIAAPTSSSKNYCWHEWIENAMQFNYLDFKIELYDNTNDSGINAKYLNSEFKKMFGNSVKFQAFHSNRMGIESTFHKITISLNQMRDSFLKNGWKYLFSLETDVFPQKDIIQNLMFNRKSVVGALYWRDEGIYRKPMIQTMVWCSPKNIKSFNMVAGDDASFVDGNLKKVGSVGLGAVLISRPVLDKIKFRFIEGNDSSCDTYFSEDVYQNGWQIFSDTSQIARHKNQAWGIYKEDYH